MNKLVLLWVVFLTAFHSHAQNNISITIEPEEQWWTGVIKQGHLLPFKAATNYSFNLYGDNLYNQTQPLLLSNKGRYVWSQQPFQFNFSNNTITIPEAEKLKVEEMGIPCKRLNNLLETLIFLHQEKCQTASCFCSLNTIPGLS